MRSILLLHFHQVKLLDWTLFDPHYRILQQATETTLTTVPVQANQQVIVLLPSTEVLLTQVTLPITQRHRLQQAVPYALEEQLAEDIEQLHFALGSRDAEQRLTVAVVAQRHLDNYLNELREISLTATLVSPEIFAIPFISGSWSIMQYGQRILVRTGKQSGFAVEPENLHILLSLASLPSQLVVWGKISESVHLVLTALNIPIITKNLETYSVISTIYQYPPLNLLQGTYQPNRQMMQWWRPWRLTAVLLLLWGTVQLAEFVLSYQQLAQHSIALNQQIEQIYRQTFPQAQKIVNPRVQMEQQLNELTGKKKNSSRGNILILLNQLSPAVEKLTTLNLKEINYQAGKLELSLEAPDQPTIELLKRYLKENNLNVTITTQAVDAKTLKAKLQLEN